VPDPAYQKALPHGRFINSISEIIGTRGKAYLVRIVLIADSINT